MVWILEYGQTQLVEYYFYRYMQTNLDFYHSNSDTKIYANINIVSGEGRLKYVQGSNLFCPDTTQLK